MSTIGAINISLKIFGSVLSLAIFFSLWASGMRSDPLSQRFIVLLFCNVSVLLSDACAWLLKGRPGVFCGCAVRAANFLVFVCGYLLFLAFTDYLIAYLGSNAPVSRKPLYASRCLCAAAVVLVIVSQFNHMYYLIGPDNIYRRQPLFWLSQALGVAGMALNAGVILYYRRYLSRPQLAALMTYILLPVTAMLVQMFIYGVALLNIATSVSGVVVYMTIQADQNRRMKEKELELADSRRAVMLSQIQPHFLFNVLTAISRLCDVDSVSAKHAIVEF